MIRVYSSLDSHGRLRYLDATVRKSDKNIDKILRLVYNQCRKYAIMGVRYGIHNNGQ